MFKSWRTKALAFSLDSEGSNPLPTKYGRCLRCFVGGWVTPFRMEETVDGVRIMVLCELRHAQDRLALADASVVAAHLGAAPDGRCGAELPREVHGDLVVAEERRVEFREVAVPGVDGPDVDMPARVIEAAPAQLLDVRFEHMTPVVHGE